MADDRLKLAVLWSALAEDASNRLAYHGPLWSELSASSGRALATTVRGLRRNDPAVWGLFGSEQEVAIAIVDVFETYGASDEPTLSVALHAAAKERWLIEAPIVNVAPPNGLVVINPETVIVPTADRDRDVDGRVLAIAHFDTQAVGLGRRRHHDQNGTLADTRHTASLLTARAGTRSAAKDIVMTQAKMAVAVWTLLQPPHLDAYMPMWPTVTEWLPQPWLHVDGRTVEFPGDSSTRPEGFAVRYPDDTALYPLPAEPVLSAAHRAIAHASTRRCARALLTAAWQLYLAARLPTDLLWLDRLVAVMVARDAMCEPAHHDASAARKDEGYDRLEQRRQELDQRWRAGRVTLGVDAKMRRAGWTPGEINSVNDRARHLRHLGVHSADASLIALGFPPHMDRPMRRGPILHGPQLSPLAVREAVGPAYAAIRLMAVGLWEQMLDDDFDDDGYDAALSG